MSAHDFVHLDCAACGTHLGIMVQDYTIMVARSEPFFCPRGCLNMMTVPDPVTVPFTPEREKAMSAGHRYLAAMLAASKSSQK